MFSKGIERIAVVFVFLHVANFGFGGWLLEIKLVSYSNTRSTQENGQCCDSSDTSNCSQDARCDNILCLLLRPYEEAYLSAGAVSCLYYVIGNPNSDNIEFGSTILTQNGYLENPLAVTDTEPYPQYQLVVIVQDQDTMCIPITPPYCWTYLEPVDEIYVNFLVHPSSNFSTANATTGRYQIGTISTSFRLKCSPNWYGQDCGKFCMTKNNGTLVCDNDGNKICLKGWSGTNCSNAICSSGCPSPTRAFCDVPDQCTCLPGWSGALCTHCIPQEGCSSIGGYCLEPYQCLCHENYTGKNCTDILNNNSSVYTTPDSTTLGHRSVHYLLGTVSGVASIFVVLLVAVIFSIIIFHKSCRAHRVIIITNQLARSDIRTEIKELV